MQRPTEYADQLGQRVIADLPSQTRKGHGVYLTPEPIARYMAGKVVPTASMRLLDPAAGVGVLSCAVVERMVQATRAPVHIHIAAYEILPELHRVLVQVLEHAASWAAGYGATVTFEAHCGDYVLSHADPLLRGMREPFDVVVANPPYFKLGSNAPHQRAMRGLLPRQPNIYSLFLALATLELRSEGELVFITPRSFTSGLYFKPFREYFFQHIQPLEIHVFGSRRQAFKRDAVLQETLILHGRLNAGWAANTLLTMSHSDGIEDMGQSCRWPATFDQLCDPHAPGMVVRLPSSKEDQHLIHLIDALPQTLTSLGLCISTGPVVAFRARDQIVDTPGAGHLPLLWLANVTPDRLRWPLAGRTGQYLRAGAKHTVPTQNCVLLRRFSAKDEPRRLTAAPLLAQNFPYPGLGVENHLNYLYRPDGSMSADEAAGLAAILNSGVMDRYFRCVSGNTQVGAAELRAMPLPNMDTMAQIGRVVTSHDVHEGLVDRLILESITQPAGAAAD